MAGIVATLVFLLWYPSPLREVSGGRELFLLVVTVDVILGPLLTFIVFDRNKPRAELRRDLTIVALLQLMGLGYGLHTVEEARPAVIALERNRLRVVRSMDLDVPSLREAPPEFRQASWLGPMRVAARQPQADEKFDVIQSALNGLDIGARPKFWMPAAETSAAWAEGGIPLSKLRALYPARQAELEAAIAATGRPEGSLKYLPIIARRTDYVLLIDAANGQQVGYAAFDGHF